MRNDAARKLIQGRGVKTRRIVALGDARTRAGASHRRAGGCVEVVGCVADFLQLGGREIPLEHARCGNRGTEQAGIQHLIEVLEASEEEQLVAVLVEVGSRNDHRATEAAAWIIILILGFGGFVGVI